MKARNIVLVAAILASGSALAQTSISIGVNGRHGGFAVSTSSGYPVYGYPVYTEHPRHYHRHYYQPLMPAPVIVYQQPQVIYQQPQVVYQQPYVQYRGGTYYAPDNVQFGCTSPREYDRVCNSTGSFCVTCN